MSATPEHSHPATGSRTRRLGRALVVAAALLVSAPAGEASADPPLFAFAQFSDVQASLPEHSARFDQVLDALADAGEPGALLPHAVAFVVVAGDRVNAPKSLSEWDGYRASLDQHLSDAGIPWLAVPGNHDQDEFGALRYEEYLADAGVWDASSAELRGHNGLVAATGWSGLRFVGVNSSYLAWNQVRAADVEQVKATELRLFVTDPSGSGGRVVPAAGGWTEGGITWQNAPGLGPEVLDAADISPPDGWIAST